jgi:hypothetical protein
MELNDNIITETSTLRTFMVDFKHKIRAHGFGSVKIKDIIEATINSGKYYITSTNLIIQFNITHKNRTINYDFQCPEIFPDKIWDEYESHNVDDLYRIIKILNNKIDNITEQLTDLKEKGNNSDYYAPIPSRYPEN